MKKIALLSFFLIFIVSCDVCKEQRAQFYSKGLTEGYYAGLAEGKKIGYEEGKNTGLEEGSVQGYEKGYKAGEQDNERKHIERKKRFNSWIIKICYVIIFLFGLSIIGFIISLIFLKKKGLWVRILSVGFPFLLYALISEMLGGKKFNFSEKTAGGVENTLIILAICSIIGFLIPFSTFKILKDKKYVRTNFMIAFYVSFLLIFIQIHMNSQYDNNNIYLNLSLAIGPIFYFMVFQNPQEFIDNMYVKYYVVEDNKQDIGISHPVTQKKVIPTENKKNKQDDEDEPYF